MKLSYYFDFANNITVELFSILCWYPILLVENSSNLMDFIVTEKARANPKACDVPRVAISCIPISCDLRRIFLIQHRIEDRFPEKPRRKGSRSIALYRASSSCPIGRNRTLVSSITAFTSLMSQAFIFRVPQAP